MPFLLILNGCFLLKFRDKVIEGFDKFTELVYFEAHGAQKPEFTRPLNYEWSGLHVVNEDFEHRATKKLTYAGGFAKPSNRETL